MSTASEFKAAIATVRAQGWALVDQELEMGLRSVAAPINRAHSGTIAAINCSAAAQRVSIDEFSERIVPALLETAKLISAGAGAAGEWQIESLTRPVFRSDEPLPALTC